MEMEDLKTKITNCIDKLDENDLIFVLTFIEGLFSD